MQGLQPQYSRQQDLWEREAYSLLFSGGMDLGLQGPGQVSGYRHSEGLRPEKLSAADYDLLGGSGHHPRSSPSDESHASAARPTATALCTDVSVPYESAKLHDAACKTVSAGGPLLCTDAANLLGSESLGSDRADAASTQGPQTTGSTQTGAGTAAAQEAAAGAASPATGASQRRGQYGSRAALQVRPVKRRRKAATQAAAQEPASSAAAAGCQTVLQAQYAVEAALAKADAACRPSWEEQSLRQGLQQQLEPLEAQGSRVRHVSSHRETDMGALVNSLQQPQGHTSESQAECLSTLQELNTLRTMEGAARPGLAARMRKQNVQGLMVQPGWHQVLPCDYSIVQIYQALEAGNLDMPVCLDSGQHGRFTNLRQVAAIPFRQQLSMFHDASARIVNAMHLKLDAGDVCDRTLLRLAGDSSFMGCVFFQPQGSLHVHGRDYENGRTHAGAMSSLSSPRQLKGDLRLDSNQLQAARQIWKQVSAALVKLEAERAEILSQIYVNDAQMLGLQGAHMQEASKTGKLLDRVAELSENAQVQQEVLRHGVRVLVWQICSPATLTRLVCSAWPTFPDLISTLQAIASPD
ncbi:hypothetical protein WJX84_004598 [Apatococcus fuscideae]|uniref:Uncharacterized protein n=1 Tax=Apatococcus fuscideae TaxID=2026836 RepID=A0AAW1T8Q3_9CHLO